MVAGEHDIRPTCLSDLEHDDAIQNHVLHYLGCIEIGQRGNFYRKIPKKLQEACTTELNRIDYLRALLATDEVVQNLDTSRAAWQSSQQYKVGIRCVQNWRSRDASTVAEGLAAHSPTVSADPSEEGNQGGSGNPPKQEGTISNYQPEKDFNLHIIEFGADDDHQEDEKEGSGPVQTKRQVSDRKVKIHDILEGSVPSNDLTNNPLYGGNKTGKLMYIHLPANNMFVSQHRFLQI